MAKARKISRPKKPGNTRTKKQLGLGVGALLSGIAADMNSNDKEKKEKTVKTLSNTIALLPIDQIHRNVEQPRTHFADEPLQELADSIKTYGLIQPITVRLVADDEYQIISGERRWRASKLAKLEEIPAYIRIADSQELLEMALVENIQREDLNPIEIALTYRQLIDECGLTHKELAPRVGKKRGTITNYLSVLNLDGDITKAIRDYEISLGHGKVLAGIKDEAIQKVIFQQISEKNLSVRAAEGLAKKFREANITIDHWNKIKGTEDTNIQNFLFQEIKENNLTASETGELAKKFSDSEFTIEHWKVLKRLGEYIQDPKERNDTQHEIYDLIIDKGLSVRATEEWVNNFLAPQQEVVAKKAIKLPDAYERVQDNIRTYFGTKGIQIKLNANDDKKGQIVIPFDKNNDNLNRLLELLD